MVPAPVRGELMAAARDAGVLEACGLLVGSERGVSERAVEVRIDRSIACDNVAPEAERNRRFEIDPRRLIEEEREARADHMVVVGFYHSHPASDPVPSEIDRRFMALWPESVWVIVGLGSEDGGAALRAWEPGREPGEPPSEIAVVGG